MFICQAVLAENIHPSLGKALQDTLMNVLPAHFSELAPQSLAMMDGSLMPKSLPTSRQVNPIRTELQPPKTELPHQICPLPAGSVPQYSDFRDEQARFQNYYFVDRSLLPVHSARHQSVTTPD